MRKILIALRRVLEWISRGAQRLSARLEHPNPPLLESGDEKGKIGGDDALHRNEVYWEEGENGALYRTFKVEDGEGEAEEIFIAFSEDLVHYTLSFMSSRAELSEGVNKFLLRKRLGVYHSPGRNNGSLAGETKRLHTMACYNSASGLWTAFFEREDPKIEEFFKLVKTPGAVWGFEIFSLDPMKDSQIVAPSIFILPTGFPSKGES